MVKMTGFERGLRVVGAAVIATAVAVPMTGCNGFTGANMAATLAVPNLAGSVHGGQQPINGAAIYFYAAGTSGYAGANTNILTSAVSTNASGGFNITGKYSCSAGQQMYIVAIGGNTGSGTNANSALMAALGDCANLSSATFINMNEVTTVGSAFALAPFMSGYGHVGTSGSNTAGLVRAFASVNKLVNIATGTAVGSALPAGATGPTAELDSLANALASCVNSQGTVNGQTTNCGTLFGLATPPGGATPTDTIGAAVAIAQNPALNVGAIYNTASGQSPFAPALNQAPNDWAMAINYSTGGFNTPKSTTIDANGNVWVANSGGGGSVSVLAQTGTPLGGSPFSGNGLTVPSAIAIDASGDAWVANRGGATISVFTPAGGVFGGSPFTPGGLSGPAALAFDASGNLWVANAGNSSVTEVSSSGTALAQVTTGISSPTAIAVNPK